MGWRAQKNRSDDCYFCSVNIFGYNSKTKQVIVFPGSEPSQSIDDALQSSTEFNESQPCDNEFQCFPENVKPQCFTQD